MCFGFRSPSRNPVLPLLLPTHPPTVATPLYQLLHAEVLGLDPRPGLAAKARAELEGSGQENGAAQELDEATEEAEERRKFDEGYCVLVDGVGESRPAFTSCFLRYSRLLSDINSAAYRS